MSNRNEYKVISENNPNTLSVELNKLGIGGWKPILMTTVHSPSSQGIGEIVFTVVLEHPLPG